LVQHAESTEWLTAHAAENPYCQYCNTDSWRDQHYHNEGCLYVKMMNLAKQFLQSLDKENC